jgi:hypothetical protein
MTRAVIHHKLPFRKEPYILTLHVPSGNSTPSASPHTGSCKSPFSPQSPILSNASTFLAASHALPGPRSLPHQRIDAKAEQSESASDFATMAGRWWPHKRFMQHANYDDAQFKLQRWFGVDIFITVRLLHPHARVRSLHEHACIRSPDMSSYTSTSVRARAADAFCKQNQQASGAVRGDNAAERRRARTR